MKANSESVSQSCNPQLVNLRTSIRYQYLLYMSTVFQTTPNPFKYFYINSSRITNKKINFNSILRDNLAKDHFFFNKTNNKVVCKIEEPKKTHHHHHIILGVSRSQISNNQNLKREDRRQFISVQEIAIKESPLNKGQELFFYFGKNKTKEVILVYFLEVYIPNFSFLSPLHGQSTFQVCNDKLIFQICAKFS